MKRTILLTTFVVSILFSGMAAAQEIDPCQGVAAARIVTNYGSLGIVQRALTNYNGARVVNGNYCIVFEISVDEILARSDGEVFSLNVEDFVRGHGSQDIYINDLRKLKADSSVTLPLLTITNNTSSRVIVTGLQMTNVKNGLKLVGAGPIEVRGSTITGAGGDPATRTGQCVDVQSAGAVVKSTEILNCNEGIKIIGSGSQIESANIHDSPMCVNITGDNARIQSSQISNCAEGIKIAASNVFLGAENPSAYETDRNTLIGNTIGIHQTSGAGNKWPFNSISGGDGIVVDGGVRPVMCLAEGNLASLTCTQPEDATAVTACEMQFDSMAEMGGEVEVYKTLLGSPVDSQGKDYIARCAVAETNKCIFDASNASILVSQIMCGDDVMCDFTALQMGSDSSMYTRPFKLDADISTIIMSPETGPIAGPSGMGGGGASGEGSGGGGPPAGEGLYIEGTDTGTLLVTEQPGGGGTGTVQQQAGSLPISVKACRFASAGNERAKGVFEMWWWLVFVLPACFFGGRAKRDPRNDNFSSSH